MPAETAHGQSPPAQLDVDILTFRKPGQGQLPVIEYFLAFSCIRADAQWAGHVVKDDADPGKRTGQVNQFGNLRVVQPGVEGEPEIFKTGETGTKFFFQQ